VAGPALAQDNIEVVIEGDDTSGVHTDADGNISIDQDDGGVVIQLNPQRQDHGAEADDPQKFYSNLVDRIGEGHLSTIANQLHEAISADDNSRSEWLTNRAEAMDLLGLRMQDPRSGDGASAVDGQSVVTNPLLLDAVIRGWARAQAELLPAEGPCKIVDYSALPEGQKDLLGEAFERDMNYFLTSTAKEFRSGTSHMLLWGSFFGGSGFKKVYTHPIKKRPYSEAIDPKDLIVSDASKDFDECERITHQISMRQSVMKRYQAKKIYRQVDLAPPNPQPNQVDEQIASTQGVAANRQRPEDMPYTLWECQCELNLPEFQPPEFKEIELPYLVTMDKDSMVILSIRRDWKPEDEECTRKKMYVKYPYVPGPGFYGTGLANIIGNSSAAMTAAWRLALDNGMFANFPAGLVDKLAGRQNTVNLRAAPGELIGIETGGRAIKDVVADLPFNDVTPGLMSMIDKITEQAKNVGGAPEIPVGEGTANIPVGTMLAHIEQATQTIAAVHKDQHAAMDEELELIADLFRENPESFWKGNKNAKGYWTVELLMQALSERTLQPRSDPNVPSHIHRVMKAVALVELKNGPLGARLDADEVLRRVLSAMREDPKGLILPPAPQGPSAEDKMAEAKGKEADAKILSAKVKQQEIEQKPQITQMETAGSIKEKTIDLAKTLITHQGDREDAHNKHQVEVAKLAQGANQDALQATKNTTDALQAHQENQRADREHGLAAAQAIHAMSLADRQHALASQQAGHQMRQERAEGGLAQAEFGLKTVETGHKIEGESRDRDLAERELTAKVAGDNDKMGVERVKAGVAQQDADTRRHSTLHPPKPAGGPKRPKERK
jgi:hypothetical protein